MSNSGLAPANGGGIKADLTPYVFQSSTPEDMQAQVQAHVDLMIAGTIAGGLLDVAIAGAGDGHSFMTTIIVDANGGQPPAGTHVIVYSAASEAALAAAITAALTQMVAGDALQGHGLAGAAQGRRWMGLMVAGQAG